MILKNILIILSIIFIGVANPGCIHNYDPVISLISAEPNPVSKGGTVNLICKASDDDDSNRLKDDNLSYSWVAAVGEIVSEDLDNTAVWTAPQQTGKFSISCSVTDDYNGLDIGTIEITVQ